MKLSDMPKIENYEEKSKNISQKYEELKNCSSDELFTRLSKEIQMQKNNGTFDYNGILSSIEKMKAYLPKNTYENMIRIINSLKWI